MTFGVGVRSWCFTGPLLERVYDHVFDPVYKKSCANSSSNPVDGTCQVPCSTSKMSVSGATRCMFFRKPLVQNLFSFEPIVTDSSKEGERFLVQKPQTDDKAVARKTTPQTLFRESEAQTDPYSPHYFTHRQTSSVAISTDDNGSETIKLTQLKCTAGQGDPKEASWICRIRERREETKRLFPVMSDGKSIKLQEAFLQGREQLEFKARERELDELLENRFASFKENLYAKYAESERRAEEKIAELRRIRASHEILRRKTPIHKRKSLLKGNKNDKIICTTKEKLSCLDGADTSNIYSAPLWSFIIQSIPDLTPLSKSQYQTTLMEEHGQRSDIRKALALRNDLKLLLSGTNDNSE